MRDFFLLLLFFISLSAQAQKTVFWPPQWNERGDDFYNRLSYDRSYQSDNFVIFWGDLVGTDPANYHDADKRFNPRSVADTLEKIYTRFVTELKFVNDAPNTNLGKYKIIIVMLGTFTPPERNGFAYGGSYSNTIGAMWVNPLATKDGGALSHELAHSLQMMHHIQDNPNPRGGFQGYDPAGFFYEGHANYMRSMMYQRMANTDVPRWLATRNYHWSSTRHHYANFHLLFHVQEEDGFAMTRRLWSESVANEHPLVTLSRLKGLSQSQLNDYLWGYARKQATFDYKVNSRDQISATDNFGRVVRNEINTIASQNPRFLWKQYTILDKVAGATNRYVVNDDWAPQDYGVNVIPLHTTCTGDKKTVHVKFKGHTEVNPNHNGWRYGFVTSLPDGTISRYSEMYADNEKEISFELRQGEKDMFLVVMGAPKQHTSYPWEPGYPKIRRYPYEVAIENAVPEGYQPAAEFRSRWKTNGRVHSNGGGWVANGATVASSVYVSPYAIVRSGNVSGNVRIEGHAWVEGATVSGNVVIKDNACVFRGTYSGDAVVEGNAFLENCTVSQNARVTDNAFVFGVQYSGTVVMGGDSENGNCSSGVYLQFPHGNNGRTECDGQGAGHASNQDINGTYNLFSNQQMAFAGSTGCSDIAADCHGVTGGGAVVDACGKCIGGTTGQVSDDADGDGIMDCEDECPNDPDKVAAGICGCGEAESACVTNKELSYELFMTPMSDYTPTSVSIAGLAEALGMTAQQIASSFGTSIQYYGVNPDGSMNATSTAKTPGHWYNRSGAVTGWGNDAYVYSELNLNTFTANIGQYPDRCQPGDAFTIRQALVYTQSPGNTARVTLVFNIRIKSDQPDCNGVSGGSADYDACGQCAGGNTGVVPVTDPDNCLITAIIRPEATRVNIYPNPTRGELYLDKGENWILLDMLGTELLRGSGGTISLHAFSTGVYLVKINSQIYKVVKE